MNKEEVLNKIEELKKYVERLDNEKDITMFDNIGDFIKWQRDIK